MEVIRDVSLHTGNVSNRQLGVDIREASGKLDGNGIKLILSESEEQEILDRAGGKTIPQFFGEILAPQHQSLYGPVVYFIETRILTTGTMT